MAVLLLITGPASAQEAADVANELKENKVYISRERDELQAIEEISKVVENVNSDDLNVVVAIPNDPEPVAQEFAENLAEETEAELVLVFEKGETVVSHLITSEDEEINTRLDKLRPSLECSAEAVSEIKNTIEIIEVFVNQLKNDCTTEEIVEPDIDEFGAENISFVIDEVSADGVYVGKTMTHIDEAELVETVRQIGTDYKVIVIAPDNPQPSAAAFARRIGEQTNTPVLLFRKGDRAVSHLPTDEKVPKLVFEKQNQGCATKAVWSEKNESKATEEFVNRLKNGCPFEIPTFILFVLMGLLLLVGIFGITIIKEREDKLNKKLSNIPPPLEIDRIDTD